MLSVYQVIGTPEKRRRLYWDAYFILEARDCDVVSTAYLCLILNRLLDAGRSYGWISLDCDFPELYEALNENGISFKGTGTADFPNVPSSVLHPMFHKVRQQALLMAIEKTYE